MRRLTALLLLVALVLGGANATPAQASIGTQHCPEVADSVLRLYRAYFTRDPDPGGFGYWLQQYLSGTPLTAISDAFTHTPEFTSRYAGVDNRGFVDLVYQNVLQRQPDRAGSDYWTNALDVGALLRGGVMVLFSESPEFVAKTGTATPFVLVPGTLAYCGAGDEVVGVATPGGAKGAILLAVMHGEGHHAIVSHGPGFAYNQLLVNDIGFYVGERLMDLEPQADRSESLEVQSDDRWILLVEPLSAAAAFSGQTSGGGDRVMRYTGGRGVGHFTHAGNGNFIIEAVTATDWDLVVNEIGAYDGRRPVEVAPSFLSITADGAWTATIPG
jgi:hypothetical protein